VQGIPDGGAHYCIQAEFPLRSPTAADFNRIVILGQTVGNRFGFG
jgi:hypothetical protein